MVPLTSEENELYHEQKVCHICKQTVVLMIKNSEILVILLVNIEELLMMFVICIIKYQKKFYY